MASLRFGESIGPKQIAYVLERLRLEIEQNFYCSRHAAELDLVIDWIRTQRPEEPDYVAQ